MKKLKARKPKPNQKLKRRSKQAAAQRGRNKHYNRWLEHNKEAVMQKVAEMRSEMPAQKPNEVSNDPAT